MLVAGDGWLKCRQQLSRDGAAQQQAGYDGVFTPLRRQSPQLGHLIEVVIERKHIAYRQATGNSQN